MEKSKKKNQKIYTINKDVLDDIILLITLSTGLFITLCIYSSNVGVLGKFIGITVKGLLGIGAYILPVFIIFYSIYMIVNKVYKFELLKDFNFIMILWILLSIIHISNRALAPPDNCSFFEYIYYYFVNGNWSNGGLLGAALGNTLVNLIGIYGAYISLFVALVILTMLFTKKTIYQLINKYLIQIKIDRNKKYELDEKDIKSKSYNINYGDSIIDAVVPTEILKPLEDAIVDADKKKYHIEQDFEIENSEEIVEDEYDYELPLIEFLNKKPVQAIDKAKLESEMKENALKLEKTLKSFGVIASVLEIFKGPTVTRYELQPKEGVKVSKIVNLSDDIALNLAASGLRIEAPIPGKSAIGIEVPNKDIQAVYLREIVESREFKDFESKLAFGVGKDISGKIIVTDIAKMPHVLIAGATGSGKSVCINTIITSILYKAKPKEVKFIMIDPKVVELSVYNGIPHLLIPVVTDPEKAADALNWAVKEMLDRYKLFAKSNVRDIKSYNQKLKRSGIEELMSEMVIIIDELADLMMVSPKGVEEAICRLAQMARAAGMHLIIATQRPSVDVITGVIKANIPSRIAFEVSSGIDSRTILDMVGAEKLLGRGDMLFYPSGIPKPIRVQGAFISDDEVEKVVEFVKSNEKADYSKDIIDEVSSSYIDKAINLISSKDKISILALQRQLKINFNQATNLMDELEQKGVVSEDDGSKQRKVLISSKEFDRMGQDF